MATSTRHVDPGDSMHKTVDLPSDITQLGACELSDAIAARKTSCVEVMTAYLDRIDTVNPDYNAVVSLRDRDSLMDEATAADRELDAGNRRGWMHGMPHAVKDLADVKGLPNSNGSRIFADQVSPEDSLFVARIRAAGAIFIGKTNTPEFGFGSHTYNDVHGTTCNAWDKRLTAGGSSGGAAVGLATHMLPVADGSDMMGSLRNPAGYNNVVGFRPSLGRVPDIPRDDANNPRMPVSGPMGRNVADTICLLGTMAGYDPRDPLCLRDSLPPRSEYVARCLGDTRIGWMGNYDGYLPVEDDVMLTCEAALKIIGANGAVVEHCKPDYDMDRLWQVWLVLRHWSSGELKPLYDNPDYRKLLKPEVIWEIEGSLALDSDQLRDAGRGRTDWIHALNTLFETYDVLALPTAQLFPFDAAMHWPKTVAGVQMDTYHRWMEVVIGGTLAGLPVVALPAGFNADGIPVGIQFIGRAGQDQRVLEFALAYERATEYLDQQPPVMLSGKTH